MGLGLGTSMLLSGGLGALGSFFGNQQSQSFQLPELSGTGRQAQNMLSTQLSGLQDLIGQGPGSQDISSALGSQRSLADLLGQYAGGSFLPGEQDFQTANQFAEQAFRPERQGLQDLFEQQRIQTDRQAAILGRQTNDPILQAKRLQSQDQSLQGLLARQGAFSSQFAQQLPMQRLQFAGQQANVKQGLAQQALGNRFQLAGLGQSVLGAERGFQMGTAGRTMSSGGGFGQAIAGGLAGLGQGARTYGLLSALGGLGGSQPGINQAVGGTPNLAMYGRMA